eukprot:6278297-Prymnesium_polylepis.1
MAQDLDSAADERHQCGLLPRRRLEAEAQGLRARPQAQGFGSTLTCSSAATRLAFANTRDDRTEAA